MLNGMHDYCNYVHETTTTQNLMTDQMTVRCSPELEHKAQVNFMMCTYVMVMHMSIPLFVLCRGSGTSFKF